MFINTNSKICKYSYFKIILFIYLFLAALSLCCCVWAFSSCCEVGFAVHRLLIAVASLVVEHRFLSAGSVLSSSPACGIFLDQGSNLCPLHWQVDA